MRKRMFMVVIKFRNLVFHLPCVMAFIDRVCFHSSFTLTVNYLYTAYIAFKVLAGFLKDILQGLLSYGIRSYAL